MSSLCARNFRALLLVCSLYRYLRTQWNAAPVLGQLHNFENISEDEEEEETPTAAAAAGTQQQQQVGHAIQMAHAQGANVFEQSSAASSGLVPPSPSGFVPLADRSPEVSPGDEPNYFEQEASNAGMVSPTYDESDPFVDDRDVSQHMHHRAAAAAHNDQEYSDEQAPQDAKDLNLV